MIEQLGTVPYPNLYHKNLSSGLAIRLRLSTPSTRMLCSRQPASSHALQHRPNSASEYKPPNVHHGTALLRQGMAAIPLPQPHVLTDTQVTCKAPVRSGASDLPQATTHSSNNCFTFLATFSIWHIVKQRVRWARQLRNLALATCRALLSGQRTNNTSRINYDMHSSSILVWAKRAERAGRAERTERTERAERAERTERAERAERPEGGEEVV